MSATPAEQLSRPDRPGGWPLVAGLVVLGPWLSALTTTQLLAYRLGYAQALGEPWLVPAFHPAVYAVGTVTAVAVAGWLVGQGRARVLSLFALALAGVFGALVFGPLYPPLRGLGWLGPALTASATRPLALLHGSADLLPLFKSPGVPPGSHLVDLNRPWFWVRERAGIEKTGSSIFAIRTRRSESAPGCRFRWSAGCWATGSPRRRTVTRTWRTIRSARAPRRSGRRWMLR